MSNTSNQPKTIIRKAHNKENPYAQISKTLLRDNRLSAKAMGIMCYLLGLPDHWRLCIEELAKHFSDGQKSIKSGLKQLEKLGYIERFQHRREGGVFGVIEMLIHEEPIFAAPAVIEVSPRAQNRPAVEPLAQKRPAVKRPAVKGMLVNTDQVNTDFNKNIQQQDVVVSEISGFDETIVKMELVEMKFLESVGFSRVDCLKYLDKYGIEYIASKIAYVRRKNVKKSFGGYLRDAIENDRCDDPRVKPNGTLSQNSRVSDETDIELHKRTVREKEHADRIARQDFGARNRAMEDLKNSSFINR